MSTHRTYKYGITGQKEYITHKDFVFGQYIQRTQY